MPEGGAQLAREALRALGIRRLAFAIHDASFPAGDFDPGRGTPYTESALSLLRFVAGLGFDILQLGPQGETSPSNPSPYDGAAFSRCTLSVSAAALCEKDAGALLTQAELQEELGDPDPATTLRANHAAAWRTQRRLLGRAFRRFQRAGPPGREALREREAAFALRHDEWLARDGLYEALSAQHGGRGFAEWPEPDRRLLHPGPPEGSAYARRRARLEDAHREAMAFHRFRQLLAHEQHAAFRSRLREIGLRVYGDLQIGLADRDVWAFQPYFLAGYALGAPPSRTNPEGQPWGFPVFDPARYRSDGGPGEVMRIVGARMDRIFEACDAVRIDHPHGLVCPWVYRTGTPDPQRAVRDGARLFCAAGLPGHRDLARHDIPRPDQIDPERLPWDDRRVRDLDPEQVERYALLFDEVAHAAQRTGGGSASLVCEVLSTLPLPLERVMQRFGLGRFRITGKLDPADPADPYRLQAAEPPDWVMIGTHDTPPLWQLLERWEAPRRAARAAYTAALLEPDPERRAGFAEVLVRDPGLLAQAMLAELFASRAENASVFFTDLLGMDESYNRPGTVSSENWSLRVPPGFRELYRERVARHRALNVPLALALALRARQDSPLLPALFEEAARLAPVPEVLARPRRAR